MMNDFFERLDFGNLKPEAGRLLISEPYLFDPNFKRTVILLVEHNEKGSVGFILNRPVELEVNDIVEDFPEFQQQVSYGGPVGQDGLYYIHTAGAILEGSTEVMEGLYWGGNTKQLKYLINTRQIQPEQMRFFVGYSGWAPGQLEEELEQRSWIVTHTDALQVMQGITREFWKDVLKSMGKQFAMMAGFPEDPTLN